MRLIAGIVLVSLLPVIAFAQARGQVETVGFAGAYRPGCWTPMVVQLIPTTGTAFAGRIEVIQEDLDRDNVIFTRQITLTGNTASGSAPEQRFWMYFLPQPSKGDREALEAGLTADQLTRIIRVRLVSESGKELVRLPITQSLRPVESLRGGMGAGSRGMKLILAVSQNHQPNFKEFEAMTGLTEDLAVVTVRGIGNELPDSVIGYDAVDAIVWTDGDPTELSAEQLTALEEFVKRGGKLVLSQDTAANQWQRNSIKFPLLIPVIVKGIEERDDKLETLRQLGRVNTYTKGEWDKLKGPFKYAVADPKPGTSVVAWQRNEAGDVLFDETGRPKPYIVRHAVGAGSVTWVAQDLGDPQVGIRSSPLGWSHIWDEVMDWRNEPVFAHTNRVNGEIETAPYKSNITWEFGKAFLGKMDLPSTSAALIGIAVLFFIVYWVAAGPGSYFVLLKRNRSSLSWFTFAAMAIAATGLTVLIVKLVLRGAPQVQHVSFVRYVPGGEPARVHSQFGLYIPRDGAQKIELKNAAPNRASYITAFNLHPAFNQTDIDFPARQEYRVPVKELRERDREPADPKSISIPYRSTLKKFQAEWVGSVQGGIDGNVKLAADLPQVRGTLTNNTGRDLRMVYIVVNHPAVLSAGATLPLDHVLYLAQWKAGDSIDLDREFRAPNAGGAAYIRTGADLLNPTSQGPPRFKGTIQRDLRNSQGQSTLVANWTDYWFEKWRSSSFGDREYSEDDALTPRSMPLLSFFDRLPVPRNPDARTNNDRNADRFDLLRRSLRNLDVSAAISGGNLAVVAVSNNREEPLPFPLEVDGSKVTDIKGYVFHQAVLPVDRSEVNKPPTPPAATQPATQSATKPTPQAKDAQPQ
jgi:hypothetical protein